MDISNMTKKDKIDLITDYIKKEVVYDMKKGSKFYNNTRKVIEWRKKQNGEKPGKKEIMSYLFAMMRIANHDGTILEEKEIDEMLKLIE